MIRRSIIISSSSYISLKRKQLQITNKETSISSTVAVEDIGILLIENQQSIITIPALTECMNNNCIVIFCDENHMPHSLMQPMEGHHLTGSRLKAQVSNRKLNGSLWKHIIEAKINNQGLLLEHLGKGASYLFTLAKRVNLFDKTSKEGHAARIYWGELFGNQFNRDRDGPIPNNLLNYGYTLLRAATARAIVGSGMLPALGIYHSNQYNTFPLADDLMEPYRVFIDEEVYRLYTDGFTNVNLYTKGILIKTLYRNVFINNTTKPLLLALSTTTSSLAECYNNNHSDIILPVFK